MVIPVYICGLFIHYSPSFSIILLYFAFFLFFLITFLLILDLITPPPYLHLFRLLDEFLAEVGMGDPD